MYNYNTQKKNIFTEEGQEMFLKIRDKAHKLLDEAGAFKLSHVISGCTGDSWDMYACVDSLIELGEIIEIERKCAGQNRVFISNKN